MACDKHRESARGEVDEEGGKEGGYDHSGTTSTEPPPTHMPPSASPNQGARIHSLPPLGRHDPPHGPQDAGNNGTVASAQKSFNIPSTFPSMAFPSMVASFAARSSHVRS